MSGLAHLHDRLSSAFGVAQDSRDGGGPENAAASRFEALGTPAPLAGLASQGGARKDRMVRFWLGGGGLVCSAFILALGFAAGFLVLAAALGAIAAGSALVYRMEKRRSKGKFRPPPRAADAPGHHGEKHADDRWERDENESLVAAIHDALGDIAIMRDMDRRIVQANATFRALTGCRNPEGRTCEEIGLAFRPDAEPYRFDVEIATPSGQRIFAWHDIVVRHPANGQLSIQSIGRDVTGERQLAHRREEARIKAEGSSAAKSRLLATVSHEIRTPLSGILGMSHLLGQTRLTAEQTNYLDGIRQSGHALVQLVEDLLDFSTIEVGRFQLRPAAESLRLLLESVVEMLAHRAHEKDIEIAAMVSCDIPEFLSFDPARLRQVLFNVIGNAVKFTHAGGVLIKATLEAGNIVITVADTGPGMTAEEQARIFAEFEQAGSPRDKAGGTGLGLSISARIMQEFGGALSVASKKGKGSVFTIRFPGNLPDGGRGTNVRTNTNSLAGTSVLLMAPDGPASTAIAATIEGLGGKCQHARGRAEAEAILNQAGSATTPLTDIIVDHRMAAEFSASIAGRDDVVNSRLRKIFLVNPEERNCRRQGQFDAWLIRPLRERSLIDVLRGRMRGMETRDAFNDNQPGLGLSVPGEQPATGLDIMLAEDDPVNAMLVRAMLEKAGHHVRLAADFEILLDAIWDQAENRPDLIVTDLNMPGGAGPEVLARIRAYERRQGLTAMPVIVLSADGSEETRRHALLKGANRVFVKPVEPERLIGEVQALAPLRAERSKAR